MGRLPRAFFLLLVCAVLPGGPVAREAPEPPAAGTELEGTWQGRDTGNLRSVWTLSIEKDRFRFDGPGPQEWYEGTLTLNRGRQPRWIDLRIEACDCTYKESTSLGLYAVEGDRLTFLGAEPGYPRPVVLETGGRTLLMNLTRRDAP